MMNDQLKELLSEFMDGEQNNQSDVSNQFKTSPQLLETWSRYHLIRDVMKNRHIPHAMTLGQRVTQAIATEPSYLLARRKPRLSRQTGQLIGWSVAASLMLVTAVWFTQQNSVGEEEAVGLTAFNQEGQPTAEVEQTLSDYIVNHNEYSASARMQGMLPYTRLISYSSTQQQAGNRVE